jgi:GMP synthase-like glutamine amidotransferase
MVRAFDLLPGATLLASKRLHIPHQAFRYGNASDGLQFHSEPDQDLWTGWTEHLPSWKDVTSKGFDSGGRTSGSLHETDASAW